MGDMRTFGMIYSVMLFGFSQSFYFLYKGFPGVESSLYHSYFSTWMALFQITLGDYNVSYPLVTDLPVRFHRVSIRFPYLCTHGRKALVSSLLSFPSLSRALETGPRSSPERICHPARCRESQTWSAACRDITAALL